MPTVVLVRSDAVVDNTRTTLVLVRMIAARKMDVRVADSVLRLEVCVAGAEQRVVEDGAMELPVVLQWVQEKPFRVEVSSPTRIWMLLLEVAQES